MIIFSILAFFTLFLSISIKERVTSLKMQSLNCIFESFYAFSIHAYTAALLSFINSIRSLLFGKKDKINKNVYFILLYIFEIIIIINCIITWNGCISLLPTIASMIRTYCLWQYNMKFVRMSGIISGILFASYYTYYQSYFLVVGYLMLFIISFYNVKRLDFSQNTK